MTNWIGNGGTTRRGFLKNTALSAAALGSGVGLFNINHAYSQDVVYAGETFDAGGATINIAEWGGFWEEIQRKELLNSFEKDFNCKVIYESSFPWFPKYVANGPKNPPFAMSNWNYQEMFKTAAAGDFFVPLEELMANVPNAKGLWPFATANGIGVTWTYARYCYAYRTDLAKPAPESFKDFWQEQFAGKRGTYITSNGLQMDFFVVSCALFGKDQYDLEAGYEAMRNAVPMKIVDFTGTMQAMLERGEVAIGVQNDAETYQQMDKGLPIAPHLWNELKPILSQVKTISRYADPMQKKLAYALLNRTLSPEFQTVMGTNFYQRPTHKDAIISANLASKGVTNTADAVDGFWTPDWKSYIENEEDIVETINGIFAG